ncbi:hypothetical protein Tco_0951335 [Tanacetum coccineum]|uniref:Uncharacterized protein n=1 Tax=Tanacetum coccineum TaxID=301880 RepID=A0ABQ5DTU1_9ASTR
MFVRQVWKRKTSTPKSSSTLQNESPLFHPHVHPQISSPPSYNPLRDEMINSLHNISTILDTHNNPSNAYNQAPPSPPPQQIYPPSHERVNYTPPPPSSFHTEDVIGVENTIESEDETVPASVHEVGESSTAPFLREDSDGLFPGLMRMDINSLFGRMASLSRRLCGRETVHALVEKKGKAKDEYYGKLILDLGNEVHSSMEQETAAMEKFVEKLGNAEDKAECKKLKKELKEARFSNTFLHMQNELVERDLYWTRVRVHDFYQEMIRRGFMFEERPNEVIDVPIEDEKSPSFEPRGSPCDS